MVLRISAGALALVAFFVTAQALTMNEVASNDLKEAADAARKINSEVAILIGVPHSKTPRRELLHAKGNSEASISLFYSRRNNKITLESLRGDSIKSYSWIVAPQMKSLVMVAYSNGVKLTVDCKSLHLHSMPESHNLLDLLANPSLKLFHEENIPVDIFNEERDVLEEIDCPLQSDMVELKDYMNARNKRDEEMQGDDYRTNYIDENGVLPTPGPQRGDIPSNAIETCDDEVIRQLQMLRQTIERSEMRWPLRRGLSTASGVNCDSAATGCLSLCLLLRQWNDALALRAILGCNAATRRLGLSAAPVLMAWKATADAAGPSAATGDLVLRWSIVWTRTRATVARDVPVDRPAMDRRVTPPVEPTLASADV